MVDPDEGRRRSWRTLSGSFAVRCILLATHVTYLPRIGSHQARQTNLLRGLRIETSNVSSVIDFVRLLRSGFAGCIRCVHCLIP